jgi:hypothetical protein
MTDPYRLHSTPTRIIVELHDGHWTAWFVDHPETAFGGSTATVFRLTGPEEPGETQQSWRDRPSMLQGLIRAHSAVSVKPSCSRPERTSGSCGAR